MALQRHLRIWTATLAGAVGLLAGVWGVLSVWPQQRPQSPSAARSPEQSAPSERFRSEPIGDVAADGDRPKIPHVLPVDLNRDGALDVVACDAAADEVVWLRQGSDGAFTETTLAEVDAPVHTDAADLDGDGDVDVAVASLGVLAPTDATIGAVLVLENRGGKYVRHTLVHETHRVSDVRIGDLDGDGRPDLAVAQFGYTSGQTRWLENRGALRFEPHRLQQKAGVINAVPADVDGDGDLDIVTLVSQHWEEIYVFVNDGSGAFDSRLVWGSSHQDFGSSWITPADVDGDGDLDILYTNGDAFDYHPPVGRPWHGIQWLENKGELSFEHHRLADLVGAYSPRPADVDGDGDLDIVAVSAFNDWEDPSAQSMIWLEQVEPTQFVRRDLTSSPTHLLALGVGDFTGDGAADLVTGGMHIAPPYDRISRVRLWTRPR